MLALPAHAAELKPQTLKAYEAYIAKQEQALAARKNFLLVEERPGLRERVRKGHIFIEERRPKEDPPDGLVHHWIGAIYIPGATLDKVLAKVKDYDRHKDYYKPEVIDSKILSRDGNRYRIVLRLLKKKVITAVLDTEHQVEYQPIDARHEESRSRSVRIQEVENNGGSGEKLLPEGTGHGFVWRLDSYWRFLEADGGVYMECTSITLSRDIPFPLGRLIRPIIDDLPEESLHNILVRTRDAVE